MKIHYLITLFFLSSMAQGQIVNIPDANFKNALVNTMCVDINGDNIGDIDADTNNDGEIQQSEASAVLGLLVFNQNISSLEGIQNFNNLETLWCYLNQLTNIDVAQNSNLKFLHCSSNQLTNLDLSQNTNLEKLWCHQNQLTILEFINNPNLKEIICYENILTTINVTQNPNLEKLWCPNNQLNSLNVSQNPILNDLLCAFNQITSLDVSQNTSLVYLGCHGNELTSLDVSQNTNLETLYCDENSITSLDISQNHNIEQLICRENQLTTLNIRNGNNHNMRTMWAYSNPNLTSIIVDCDDDANSRECDSGFTWCKDATASYVGECTLGTDDYNEIALTLYPNPTINILYINSQKPVDSVSIYSLTGSLIKQTSNSIIDVSDLSKGLYFAKISIEGRTITKKFIKF